MNSSFLTKSLDFATQIVIFYEEYSKSKKDTTIVKQLLQSATSVGANLNEAVYGNSKTAYLTQENRLKHLLAYSVKTQNLFSYALDMAIMIL